MIVVVDASTAYDLLTLRTCGEKIANAKDLIAPDLIVAELLNARWKVSRSGANAPSLERTVDFLNRLRIIPSLPHASEAAALAARLDHPVYDCFYVAIAQSMHAKLLTTDERLSKKLRSARFSSILV